MLFWQETKEPLYILEYLERRKPALQVDNLSLRKFLPVNYALPIRVSQMPVRQLPIWNVVGHC